MLSEEWYHIICLIGATQVCLFCWYQSLKFLEKIDSVKENFRQQKFHDIINQSKSLLITLNRLCYSKQMTLQTLPAFVFLGKQNLQIVWIYNKINNV